MRHDVFTLPEIVFVAGQSQTLRWRLLTEKKVPFNADGCTGNFAVVDYSDKTGDPLISKSLTFSIGDDETGVKKYCFCRFVTSRYFGIMGEIYLSNYYQRY